MKVKWDFTIDEATSFASIYDVEDVGWDKPLLQVVKVKPSKGKAKQPWRWRIRDMAQPGVGRI